MYVKTEVIPYRLQFKQPAGTSRGIYREHSVWYVVLKNPDDPDHYGMGECAPLVDLSCDALPQAEYQQRLQQACQQLQTLGQLDTQALRPYPSILFGLETALRHYQQQSLALWDTPFSRGEQGITINGLIWMADFASMLKQIEQKIELGFHCIKLKIGAIDFEQELALLRHIRQHFSAEQITIRVDANGAFTMTDAMEKLKRLAEFELHSIEQPIPPGQWQQMAELTANTPLAIALDEELIGCHNPANKQALLQQINPHYIILKPSLHGGMSGCSEWIDLAKSNNIGWWVTSALESNIGLNAIAQWYASLDTEPSILPMPQGLGTGMLYHNNIDIPLTIKGDRLWFEPPSRSFLPIDICYDTNA